MEPVVAAADSILQAVGHFVRAIRSDPGNLEYKRKFIANAGNLSVYRPDPEIENALHLCLETPGIECAPAAMLWHTMLRARPKLWQLLKTPLGDAADLSPLLHPFFLAGLKRVVIYTGEFEEFMTGLRRFLLELADPSPYVALIEAVAQYCFNTDYIFNRTDEEEKEVEDLRRELESDAAAQRDPVKVGIYACYEPLYRLRTARDVASRAPLREIVRAQLFDYFDLQERAANIPSLTDITDAVSLKVRGQYEEFPYPRWLELPRLAVEPAGPKEVLIAGCGTGKEALQTAVQYPEASILAVDLSRASLAYGAKKAEELGIRNVAFRHADILKLGSLNRTFDAVSAIGSLVCMNDPVEGWRVLADLLRPGGTMRIGLYSAIARRSVTAAREIIRRENYPDTPAGMRRFRKNGRRLLGAAADSWIFNVVDYYHLNMYRDFIFHVQEHQHTLPQVKRILADLNLEFFNMSVSEETRRQYLRMFPDDPEAKNLDNWHRLEEQNPDTFSTMYIFWCRKRK